MNNNLQNSSVQDQDAPSRANETSLCQSCFEFFGTAATDNLCSKCFQNRQKTVNVPQSKPTIAQSIIPEIVKIQENLIKDIAIEEKKTEEPPKQTGASKCMKCKKKVGLLGYECKCGSTYCKLHRLPEDHDCEFDFCSKEREKLKRANPLVAAAKLVKF